VLLALMGDGLRDAAARIGGEISTRFGSALASSACQMVTYT